MSASLGILDKIRRKGLRRTLATAPESLRDRYRRFIITRDSRQRYRSNQKFDARYGVETLTRMEGSALGVASPSLEFAVEYGAVPEEWFRRLTARLSIDHSRFTFIDYGCGKGKALMLASLQPYQKIIGIEFSPVLCEICEKNLAIFSSPRRKSTNIEIVCADVLTYEPPAVPTVFFMFNPFRGSIMKGAIHNIVESLKKNPRPVWIAYCYPNCAAFFEETGMFETVSSGRLHRLYRGKQ